MKIYNKHFTTLSFLSLVLTSCANLFETKVPMQKTENFANLSTLVVPNKQIERLNPPAQIYVSQAESKDTIIVTWSKVYGATSYYLERAISTKKDSNGRFIMPEESEFSAVPFKKIYGTFYEDKILDNPKYSDEEYSYRYFYRVCAENPRLKYDSSDFITSSDAGYLLSPPNNVKASLGESTSNIRITWDKVSGAKSYSIYRSTREDGSSSVEIGFVSSNQNWFNNQISKNDQGVDFYYSVCAKTSSETSVQSSLALGYALQDGAPPKVENVKIKSGRADSKNSISIEWKELSGDFEYAVYRTSSKDSSYTLLRKDGKSNSFTDTKSLKPNVYYYYQIQAFKKNEDESITKGTFSDSGKESKTPCEGFLLAPPENIDVIKYKSNASQGKITFSPIIGSKDYLQDSKLSTDYNNYTYIIYASDTADGNFEKLGEYPDSTISKDENGNYSIPIATKNYYKIATKNKSEESEQSKICAPSPFEATNLICSRAKNIVGEQQNNNGVFPIEITWEKPKNDIAEGGYFVYRSTNPVSGFRKITDEPIKETSYIDKNDVAKAGVYYYYKILSLNSLGQGANYTEADYGYGALTADQYMREYNKTVIAAQKKLTLMHKPGNFDKIGSETVNGKISGNLSYDAKADVSGAKIIMHYQDYAEFYINEDSSKGSYFKLTGNSDTKASIDASGSMSGIVKCEGMYPGSVDYSKIQIKGGAAAAGSYGISREGFEGTVDVDWKVGEEGR